MKVDDEFCLDKTIESKSEIIDIRNRIEKIESEVPNKRWIFSVLVVIAISFVVAVATFSIVVDDNDDIEQIPHREWKNVVLPIDNNVSGFYTNESFNNSFDMVIRIRIEAYY